MFCGFPSSGPGMSTNILENKRYKIYVHLSVVVGNYGSVRDVDGIRGMFDLL